uniref:Uncharacterized protein n=1 Tax=Oryza barthii TaxID=65489 RepID=A0A0D3EN89_9ORYZ
MLACLLFLLRKLGTIVWDDCLVLDQLLGLDGFQDSGHVKKLERYTPSTGTDAARGAPPEKATQTQPQPPTAPSAFPPSRPVHTKLQGARDKMVDEIVLCHGLQASPLRHRRPRRLQFFMHPCRCPSSSHLPYSSTNGFTHLLMEHPA